MKEIWDYSQLEAILFLMVCVHLPLGLGMLLMELAR